MSQPEIKFDQCRVVSAHIERVAVVGPFDSGTKVMEGLADKGFRVTRSGPYTNQEMRPNVDVSRFLIIAERTIID